jgi:hypothetical protein
MTQFKVGDEVQLVRDFGQYKRRKRGVIADYNCGDTHFVSFDKKPFLHVPKEAIRPYTPRIRPSKADITKLRQEISIRNEAIDRLENDVRILHSEKVRLGERNAHLTEKAAEANTKLVYSNDRVLELDLRLLETRRLLDVIEPVQAQTALSLYIWKAVAVVALVADLVLAFLLLY